MEDKIIDILKWFTELTPEKAIIAVLFGLIIYFGVTNYFVNEHNNIIQTENNKTNIDCATKIAENTVVYQEKLSKQSEDAQKKYDEYRDRVERDNLDRIKVWKEKHDIIQHKLEEAQTKQLKTDELISEISRKLNK